MNWRNWNFQASLYQVLSLVCLSFYRLKGTMFALQVAPAKLLNLHLKCQKMRQKLVIVSLKMHLVCIFASLVADLVKVKLLSAVLVGT